ncbi:MAG: rhodanese-like domain-containing protein [Archangium sp.]
MKRTNLVVLLFVILASLESPMAFGQSKKYRQAKVSFDDFKELVLQVEPHRAQRQIDFATFQKKSKEPNTIILDSRSAFRFERIHLKGAKHLAFTDFTQDNLAKVIPSFDTTILIYCNNNFEGDEVDFATKIARPIDPAKERIATQMRTQEKPRMMALNIPTYVNLFGYGYRNVFELDELLDVKDPRVVFEGTLNANSNLPQLQLQPTPTPTPKK